MAAQKGVVILVKKRIFHLVFLLTLLLPSPILARDYIDIWPEGWSEVTPLFTTSIFTDRFFVTHDAQGTSFLSADGTYFKETNLTYRRVYAGAILEKWCCAPRWSWTASF